MISDQIFPDEANLAIRAGRAVVVVLPCGAATALDLADMGLIDGWRMYSARRGPCTYVEVRMGKRRTFLHRLILDPPAGFVSDHINGNGLDNRRANLRTCRPGQNSLNTGPRRRGKRFKGVYFNRRPVSAPWWAQIYIDGKSHYLGAHRSPEEAASAYNEAALRLHGEFARLNEIEPSLTEMPEPAPDLLKGAA